MLTLRTYTDALITALEATGLTVGDADADGLDPPFCVLYPRPEGRFSGTLGDTTKFAEKVDQATCVGATREQSQWVADKVLGTLNGLSIPGRFVCRVHPDVPGTFRDDDVTPPLYSTPVLLRITSTPS